MARINLLPWREELRKKRQQDFVAAIIAGIIVTCILFAMVYAYIEGIKEYQTQRNQRLKDEITQVEKKIAQVKEIEDKKSKLNEKITLIQNLQASRPKIVHVFDELRRITPIGIHLLSFTQKGDEITMVGKSQSNSRVSEYMDAIDKSLSFATPKLKFVKGQEGQAVAGDKVQMSDFTMVLKIKADKPEEEDKDKDKTKAKKGGA
jgi:type IV pilus assembly protein PilN